MLIHATKMQHFWTTPVLVPIKIEMRKNSTKNVFCVLYLVCYPTVSIWTCPSFNFNFYLVVHGK